MESLTLQDIELRNVEVSQPLMRKLSMSDEDAVNLDRISTKLGTISVYRQGVELSASKPILVTYHDLGLNHVSNFQPFFNYVDMKLMLRSISVLHINAPGQEENAPVLPASYQYPTLDQLAEQVAEVIEYYKIQNFIGFGVGVGANILCRYALANPSIMDGLFLINPTASAVGWTEWLYQKVNVYYLGLSSASPSINDAFPESTRDYLMWHHFGKVDEERNHDLIHLYRSYFAGKSIPPRNLALFTDAYIKRNELSIIRGDKIRNFTCPVLLLCGAYSPHVEESITMNTKLNPSNSTWMKLQDCGMALEEQPGKVAEALKLFIQGLGYSLTAYERRRSSLRRMSLASSLSSSTSGDRPNALNDLANFKINEVGDENDSVDKVFVEPATAAHIVENPIAV